MRHLSLTTSAANRKRFLGPGLSSQLLQLGLLLSSKSRTPIDDSAHPNHYRFLTTLMSCSLLIRLPGGRCISCAHGSHALRTFPKRCRASRWPKAAGTRADVGVRWPNKATSLERDSEQTSLAAKVFKSLRDSRGFSSYTPAMARRTFAPVSLAGERSGRIRRRLSGR
jgi:hypothetical protein